MLKNVELGGRGFARTRAGSAAQLNMIDEVFARQRPTGDLLPRDRRIV